MIRRVGILGGGPAGLYLALLLKRRRPDLAVRVVERSPADATWGFGVVLADGGLRQLAEADPASHREIRAAVHVIPRQTFTVDGEAVPIDRARPGGAIERLALLRILQGECLDAGAELRFGVAVNGLGSFADCDVVVGADGSGSLVRDSFHAAFGTTRRLLTNRFAWFGAHRTFEGSHLDFRTVPGGALCGHYYTYAPGRSTFVMECDADTWHAMGLAELSDSERRRRTEAVFATSLGGAALVENNSVWRQFPVVTNERWHYDRYVLVGDALRTAHFSIGSGTRMALEDAIALADALTCGLDREAAFERYVEVRRAPMEKLTRAATGSFSWYEGFSTKMRRESTAAFALSFLRRTGRVDDERLVRDFPEFVAHAQALGVPGIPSPCPAGVADAR